MFVCLQYIWTKKIHSASPKPNYNAFFSICGIITFILVTRHNKNFVLIIECTSLNLIPEMLSKFSIGYILRCIMHVYELIFTDIFVGVYFMSVACYLLQIN